MTDLEPRTVNAPTSSEVTMGTTREPAVIGPSGNPGESRPLECNCPERTCQPEDNVGRFCWRTGCPIYPEDFPDGK